MPRPSPAIPTDLQQLSGRFEDWRRTRRGKLPIPEPLWAAAAEAARSHGVCQTAQVLRLEYKKLKHLTDGEAGGKPVRRRRAPAPARFVELASLPTAAAECVIEFGRATGKAAHPVERGHRARPGRTQPRIVGVSVIQITPQMRILVAIEAVDGRKGIDSLARLCQKKLQSDPFSGCLFVFRSRRGTSIRILVYDGQGFWLAQKRLSKGKFVWWPSGNESARRLEAHQAQLLLAAGNPETAAAQAREQAMSPDERLRFHQEHSEPLMKGLHEWMEAQLAERKTEPNSGLGKAISYLLNHWTKLTLFLRQAGAPIDNNIVERALKKAILNRKNALFYKTLNGARVGDLFMSLIHTCELNGANPFDYLTELLRHAEELKQHPSEWMPWNYRETLARLARPAAA